MLSRDPTGLGGCEKCDRFAIDLMHFPCAAAATSDPETPKNPSSPTLCLSLMTSISSRAVRD